jgi:hypothetical protein
MNISRNSSQKQGESPRIKRGDSYANTLGVLFYEGVKLSGGQALAISQILTNAKLHHVFVGELAVGCHSGRPHSSQHIELLVDATALERSTVTLLATLVAAKKVEKHPSFLSFLVDSVVGRREVLDIITSKAGNYGLFFAHCTALLVGTQTVHIPTAEMLVVLKYTAMVNPIRSRAKQSQDWADLLAVVDANPRLNLTKAAALADEVLPGFGEDLRRRIHSHRYPNAVDFVGCDLVGRTRTAGAPTGRSEIAQGEALGRALNKCHKPCRGDRTPRRTVVLSPLQGSPNIMGRSPRVSPWAISLPPLWGSRMTADYSNGSR